MKKFADEALGITSRNAVNSKVKGNANERVVAKILSEWTGKKFIRVPMSGGLHYENELLCGDVVCAARDFDFLFSVETKHYAKITEGMVNKFIDQALEDALRVGKYPMILLRQNGYPVRAYDCLLNVAKAIIEPVCDIMQEIGSFYIVKSEELFERVTYDEIYKYLAHGK